MCKWFLSLLLIELFVNLISKSELFYPVRKFVFEKNRFLHSLLDCPYCLSVWVSFLIVFLFKLHFDLANNLLLDSVITAFILHRLSNIFHRLLDLFKLGKV